MGVDIEHTSGGVDRGQGESGNVSEGGGGCRGIVWFGLGLEWGRGRSVRVSAIAAEGEELEGTVPIDAHHKKGTAMDE